MENKKILKVDIKQEVEKDFLDYAMSVIVSRALPDLKDGLKPVHRRIIYAMNDLKITHETPHKKSARIVGEVIGKYHPHGDSSVYEAMVRMSQDFSYRYPLVDGHGNFGSIDGDGAAAMRYTEARLSKISNYLLKDIEMNTVPYIDNYDASETEPLYLTGYFPNLLVNGASGIAVGMATSIPPHNLIEVINAIIAYIENESISIDEILNYIKGPDFPTGALMTNGNSMIEGYKTGKGSVVVRAKLSIEENGKKERIVISEIPYQTNKLKIIEKIVELHKLKTIEGITDIRDESNYEGIRIVLELSSNANSQIIINQLYKQTSLQTTFTFNMLSLNNGIPMILNIKEIIKFYVKHQLKMIIERSKFEKTKLEKKLHILNALAKAIDNIEKIVSIIKSSKKTEEVYKIFNKEFNFDEVQTKSILDMRLQRLVGLEREKIEEDIKNTIERIAYLKNIIENEHVQKEVLINQLKEISFKFGDERRTEIIDEKLIKIENEELIDNSSMMLTLSEDGYIKRLSPNDFKIQKRGGRGVLISGRPEDKIITSAMGKTKDDVLFFSDKGKVYKTKGYKINEFSRTSKGVPIINYIGISKDDKITSILSFKNKNDKFKYLILITKNGVVKKTKIEEFVRITSSGKRAISLDEGDELVSVVQTNGNNDLLIATHNGKITRTNESEFRPMSRTSRGVKGMNLSENDNVVLACSDFGNKYLATVSENGIVKKTLISEYQRSKRGAKGFNVMKLSEKTGKFNSMFAVRDSDIISLISSQGRLIKIFMSEINKQSRNTYGIKAFSLDEGEYITCGMIEFNKGENK